MSDEAGQSNKKVLQWLIGFNEALDGNSQEMESLAIEIKDGNTTSWRRREARCQLKVVLQESSKLREQLNEIGEMVGTIGKGKDIEAPIDWNACMSDYWRLANEQSERGPQTESGTERREEGES